MLRLLMILALGLFAGQLVPDSASAQTGRVRCESRDYNVIRCAANTGGGVRIANQLSQQPCIKGRSWDYDQRSIWVKDGCRADFDIAYNNGSYPGGGYPGGGYPGGGNQGGGYPGGGYRIIKCESWDYKPARCGANTNGGSVRLQRVIAGQCNQGQTWGWDRNGIWVSGGCRAEFAINSSGGYPGGSGGYPGGGSGQSIEIKCESWNYKPAQCPADTRGGVRLQRVIAGQCNMNQNWGWDRNGIWVNNGCRAVFRVGG